MAFNSQGIVGLKKDIPVYLLQFVIMLTTYLSVLVCTSCVFSIKCFNISKFCLYSSMYLKMADSNILLTIFDISLNDSMKNSAHALYSIPISTGREQGKYFEK
jgi:hypothetical protein